MFGGESFDLICQYVCVFRKLLSKTLFFFKYSMCVPCNEQSNLACIANIDRFGLKSTSFPDF